MTGEPHDPNRPKFYGRRKGRALNRSMAAVVEDDLPRYAVDPSALPADPKGLFDRPVSDLWLEIGFGSGEHLLGQAQANPDIGMIGCEPFINGVAKLVRDIAASETDTIRVLPDDARLLLDALPDACVGRVFVLFPDPWPKKRHNFRRFIGPENLPRLARVLRPGGTLRCATDHPDYLAWMLFHIRANPALRWLAKGPSDWAVPPADHVRTRYETKALAGVPHYLDFQRV